MSPPAAPPSAPGANPRRDLTPEIIALLSPAPVPAQQRWERAEAEIGLRIPGDYKALVTALGGAGALDDFFCVFEPDSRLTGSDLANLVAERDTIWEFVRSRDYRTIPAKYFQDGIRLIPFALLDANIFYWIAMPGRSEDEWGVLFVDADMDDWLPFDMSATEVIHGVLTGRIQHPVLDDCFSHDPHTFTR